MKANNKWYDVEVDKLMGVRLAWFIADEFQPTIATVLDENDEPKLAIANTADLVEECEKRGIAFMYADAMIDMIGSAVGSELVAEAFPGSTIIEIKRAEPEKE